MLEKYVRRGDKEHGHVHAPARRANGFLQTEGMMMTLINQHKSMQPQS